MRQVFRLMGMPDKVIAFDELPADLLEGLELLDCSRLPREWREFIGIREKVTRVNPERDPFTGKLMQFPPLVQKGPYAFIIDWELNHDKEKWAEIQSYVQRNAPKEIRLKDKLEDMAKPMAPDSHSELSLEVEDVVTIPLPRLGDDKVAPARLEELVSAVPDATKATPPQILKEETVAASPAEPESFKCPDCGKDFEKKQALRMHKTKKHPKEEEAVKTA